jgi:hypothetical protein
MIQKKLNKKIKINLLNVDVENHEWEVINSNDWNEFRPEVLCIEIHSSDIEELLKDRSYKFLNQRGYKLIAKTPMTCIFKDVK